MRYLGKSKPLKSSIKSLFQRINNILEEQNDIDYSLSFPNDWKKCVMRKAHQQLIFRNEETPQFS